MARLPRRGAAPGADGLRLFHGDAAVGVEAVGGFDAGFTGLGGRGQRAVVAAVAAGLQRLYDPTVEVAHLFRKRFPDQFDMLTASVELTHAGVHFGAGWLQRMFEQVGGERAFPGALARVFAGDAWERRDRLRFSRRHDAEWFFDRFRTDPLQLRSDSSGRTADTNTGSPASALRWTAPGTAARPGLRLR